MRRKALALGCALVLAAGVRANEEDTDPARFLSVKAFTLEVTAVLDDKREEDSSGAKLSLARRCRIQGTADLDRVDDASPPFAHWQGVLKGSAEASAHETSTSKDARSRFDYEGKGDLEDASVDLRIDAEAGTYELIVNVGLTPGRGKIQHGSDPESEFDCPAMLLQGDAPARKLPASGRVIAGTRKTASLGFPTQLGQTVFPAKPSKASVDFTLRPKGEEEVELIVTADDHESWIPEGSTAEDRPGNDLRVRAKLRRKGGGDLHADASEVRFELADCSEEPGVAMNWPVNGKRTKDLRFLAARNALPNTTVESETVVVVRPEKGSLREATATLTAFDWGAWGEVAVTATVQGKKVKGVVEKPGGPDRLLVPKRDKGSKIADAWKRAKGVTGEADSSDAETRPRGDGCAGDGLTLYEEYRGFFEDGAHVRLSPAEKDVFIRNEMGARGASGVAFYAKLTGLTVHGKLRANELDARQATLNAIDPNQGAGAHGARHQHAIVLRQGKVVGGPSEGYRKDRTTAAGTPREFLYVQVSPPWPLANESDSNIAHELLHATRVEHHGNFDGELHSKWIARGGKMFEVVGRQEVPIEVYRDSDGRALSPVVQGSRVVLQPVPQDPSVNGVVHSDLKVGHLKGLYSGRSDCVMRYYCAEAYTSVAYASTRYIFDRPNGELPGTALCEEKQDAPGALNDLQHSPRPRYGEASDGACAKSVCVNDQKH